MDTLSGFTSYLRLLATYVTYYWDRLHNIYYDYSYEVQTAM